MSILIVAMWFFGLLILNRLRRDERWSAASEQVESLAIVQGPGPVAGVRPNRFERAKTSSVVVVFAVASVLTLIAGVVLEQSGNVLANR